VDDGESIRLIDFEYAGLAEPAAELAGLAVGADLDESRVALMTRLYYGSAAPHLVSRVRSWQVVVRLIWSDWARERGHSEWVLDD
jgi:thiamine kinase-like enzyme